MAAKGKGDGKFKGKGKYGEGGILGDIEITQTSTTQFEGALDNAYFIKCSMKDNKWYKARILDCRLSKDYNLKRKKTDDSYEYYIHYENYNRRMDCWVPRKMIQLDNERIMDEPIQKKKCKSEKAGETGKNEEHEGFDEWTIAAHMQMTKVKNIEKIEIGKHTVDTWYYSPFPKSYHNIETMYFCEFCLSFFISKNELKRHAEVCPLNHPPGDEIYREDMSDKLTLSMYELDGKTHATYCENLSYLSKLFLDHKNLVYNTEIFLYFCLCETDSEGSHIVGYFSKYKDNSNDINLSCILIIPCYQRKGYGKFLITFSYELSRIEGIHGTPERPLSDMGKVSYMSWWTHKIIEFIQEKERNKEDFSITDICKGSGIREADVVFTMENKFLLKYSKGQMILCVDHAYLNKIYKEAGGREIQINAQKIHWVPFKFNWNKEITIVFPEYEPLENKK